MSLFDESSRRPLPQPTFEDVKHAGRKSLVGMIPIVGGAILELLALLSSPVADRRDDWLEDLQRRLQELEGKVAGFKFDDLANNEQFVSATLQATQAALRTHQEEKRKALRNGVLNVAMKKEPDELRQAVYLSLIDRFTVTHLKVLKQFEGSKPPGPSQEWIRTVVPELQQEDAHVIRMLLIDLYNQGLISNSPETENFEKRSHLLTNFGQGFLRFIIAPKIE